MTKSRVSFYMLTLVLFFVTASSHAEEDKLRGEFLGGIPTVYPSWFKESFLELQDDIDEAKEAGKRFAIIFQQDGCPYCNALIERNFSQKDIEEKAKKHFDFTTINIYGNRDVTDVDGTVYNEKTFARAKKIQFTPTIFFYDENGELALRVNGYHRPDIFNLELDYVAGKHEQTTNYRDFMLANKDKIRTKATATAKTLFDVEELDIAAKVASDKPFAVFFEQHECPACDFMHTDVMPDPELQTAMNKHDVSRIDMWGRTPVKLPDGSTLMARDWAARLNVKYAPTVILFDKAGQEVIRSEAFFKVFHTLAMFEYVSSEAYKEQPDFQRYLSAYAEHIRETGKDVNIWRTSKEGED